MQEPTSSTLDLNDLIPSRDFASFVPVSRVTVQKWAKCGLFPRPVFVNGRVWLWSRIDVNQWLSERNLPCLPDPNGKEGA